MNIPKRITVKKFGGAIPIQIHIAIKKLAAEQEITLNELYCRAFSLYIANYEYSGDNNRVDSNG